VSLIYTTGESYLLYQILYWCCCEWKDANELWNEIKAKMYFSRFYLGSWCSSIKLTISNNARSPFATQASLKEVNLSKGRMQITANTMNLTIIIACTTITCCTSMTERIRFEQSLSIQQVIERRSSKYEVYITNIDWPYLHLLCIFPLSLLSLLPDEWGSSFSLFYNYTRQSLFYKRSSGKWWERELLPIV